METGKCLVHFMIVKPSTAEHSRSLPAHAGFYQLQNQSVLYFNPYIGMQVMWYILNLGWNFIYSDTYHPSPALLHGGFYWFLLVQFRIFLPYMIFPTWPFFNLFFIWRSQMIGPKATSEILGVGNAIFCMPPVSGPTCQAGTANIHWLWMVQTQVGEWDRNVWLQKPQEWFCG